MAEVLGILTHPHPTVDAVRRLRSAGFGDVEVFSPVPSHEIEEALDRGPSRVRLWTLIGGLTGATVAYAFTIWSSYNWPLVVGGKPFASIPAYTVIAFELAVLIGGVLTVLGLVVHGMLQVARRGPVPYRPGFTGDEFGCLVRCHSDQVARARQILDEAGCTEVQVVDG
jgi:molybdopterin-containing oxidoreductase family membrane subunit